MKKPSLPHFCTLVVLSGLSIFCSAETLEQVYQQALQNDHQLRAARALYGADKEAVNFGRSGLLPEVNGRMYWSDSDTESSINGITIPDRSSDTNTTGYEVSLDQTLFSLSSWHSYKSSKASTLAAEAQLKSAEQDVIIRTAQAYFDALKAVDDLETAIAEEDALKHQLEQTRQRFQVGLTAITEVHEAQAAFDSSTVTRLSAEGQLGIAFEALEVITGRPTNILSPLKAQFPVVNPTPADREAWVEFALKNNHALASASLQAKSARETAKANRAGHFPTVTARASYTNSATADNTVSGPDLDGEDTALSLNLNIPLFAGGNISASRRQANARADQAREIFLQTQRDVVQQARSLHLSVVTGAASVKARAQAITSSQSALDATQAGYEVGTRDLVDVLNAQRNLFRAQRDYSASLYSYVISTLRLKEASGLLQPKDVSELSKWLDESKNVRRFSGG